MPCNLAAMRRNRGFRILRAWLVAALAIWAAFTPARAGELRVVASVPPIHFLLASVMEGAEGHSLELLIPSGASPHNYSLRPSEMRKLAAADLVFWVGPALETSVARVLAQDAMRARTVTLGSEPSLNRLRQRRAADGMTPAALDAEGRAGDPHLWLDPRNAAAIVRLAVARLSAIDPEHAALFARNGDAAIARINALDESLARRLAGIRDRNFVTFHDAYQYFEARYGLSNIGFVVAQPEHPAAGARYLSDLRRRAAEMDARCLFIEPEYDPALAGPVTENSPMKVAILDHMGARLPLSAESYFALMETLAAELSTCLDAR